MLENRFRDRDQSGNVVVSRARAGLDVSEVRSATCFRTKTKEEQIDPAQGFESCDITCQFAFEIFGVRADRSKALHLAKKVFAQQSFKVAHETQTIVHSQRRQRVLGKHMETT